MSKLCNLLNKFCPNGVVYKKLEDCCIFQNGFGFKSSLFKSEGIPVLRITNIKNNKVDIEDLKYVNIDDYAESLDNYLVRKDNIVIAMSGATTGKIGINDTEQIFLLNQRVGLFLPNEEVINNYFLYHYLLTKMDYFYKASGGGAQPNLSTKTILNLIIPVPPLEVQREIAYILDNLTATKEELLDKLKTELLLRKKQYEYYSNSLLTFDDDVPLYPLSELATEIYRGSGIKRDDVTETGIECVRYGEIYTKYNIHFDTCYSHTKLENVKSPKYFEHGDILFAITGESVEDIAKSTVYMGNNKCLAGGDIVVVKHNQNPKYLGYILSTASLKQQKQKGKIKSKVVHASVSDIGSLRVPIPSLEEQERIVTVLEHLNCLCDNLTLKLRTEIDSRQKQYEYYRDKLLSFDRKE